MSKPLKTYLFLFDERRSFTDDIRRKFDDESRYSVRSFTSPDEYLKAVENVKESKACKIAILSFHDLADQSGFLNMLATETKKSDPRTGVIMLCPQDKTDEARKTLVLNFDAFVPLNSSSVLRVHNFVKKLISEYNINIYRKRRNFSLLMLFSAIVLFGLVIFFIILEF